MELFVEVIMAKYKVTWYEERIYHCETIIEAKNSEIAADIAMESGNENEEGNIIRDWTDEEHLKYIEEIKETTDSGLIDSEKIND